MSRLAGKVAIVTGGAAGIGLATAVRFVQEGAKVLLVDIAEQMLQKAAATLDSAMISTLVADVTQPDEVEGYVKTAVSRYGGIDILINNAGIEGDVVPTQDYSIEMFDKVMAVNVRGVWLGMKYVIPQMERRGGGSIVITSSIAGVRGAPSLAPYATSKHAVIGLMRSAAKEFAAEEIRVNTVNPSPVHTRMMRSIEEGIRPHDPEAAQQLMAANIPMQRYAEPEDIANIMLFLASDESRFMTGATYFADGGNTA